jgi:predicted metal-dependent hydrolase
MATDNKSPKKNLRTSAQSADFHMVYGNQTITYRVLYAARRTMEIAVHPDGQVVIKAPADVKPEAIRHRVHKRARWITRQIAYFQQFQPRTPPRRYVGGETHLYLGRQYRLKLSKGGSDGVKLARGYFIVSYRDEASPATVRQLLDRWYLVKARAKFSELLELRLPEFQRMGYDKPTLHIRRMKTRWGSLSPNGVLALNRDLIRAPRDCIDYVITHELCHLKYSNHSPEFYRLLERFLPDWERRKARLELGLV